MQKPRSVNTVSAIIIAFSLFSIMASGVFLLFFGLAQEVFYNKIGTAGDTGISAVDELILRNIFSYCWIILGLALLLLFGGIAFSRRKSWSKTLLQGTSLLVILCMALPFGSMVVLSDSSALAFMAITIWVIFALPFFILILYLNRTFVRTWLRHKPITPAAPTEEKSVTETALPFPPKDLH